MDRNLLNRATDGTEAPTAGYMYIDIAKNASSSPMACQEIATFLTRKLANKQNANIKWKCLKVITKTAEAVSRGQFKRAVAQDQAAVTAIRSATNFRGPPDPVRGDEPYNRVRQAAKECLDIIYSDTSTQVEQSPFGAGVGGGMSNTYGAPSHQQSSYIGGNGLPPGGGRRMEGIGNPMFPDPRLDPQPGNNIQDILKDVGESFVGMIKDPLARNVDVRISNVHGEMPRPGGMPAYGGAGASSYGRPPPGRNELAQATGGQWTMASNRGPHAIGSAKVNDTYYKSREQGNNAFSWANKEGHASGGGVGGSWATVAPTSVSPHARQPSFAEKHSATPSIMVDSSPSVRRGGGGTAVNDGSYEKNLILELCPPGGMKPVPPPEKLLSFAKTIPSLNPDLICPVLLDCLEDGHPWIMRAKALCVMETCINTGRKTDDTNDYANFFYTCREEIEPLANHVRAAIRDPARRVLASLGIQPEAAPKAAEPPASAPPVNLLDFDDAPVPASSVPPALPADDVGTSLFGGMRVKSIVPPVSSAVAVPPKAVPPTPASGNLLDGLTIIDSDTVTPVTVAGFTDMFDTTFKSNESQEEKKHGCIDANDLAGLLSGSSAFGFINATASNPVFSNVTASAAQPPTKDSFDPLLNFSPNSARQMMQLSPEQMQAMAYQQMLMQQQMQQMQMALAMQGAGMARPGGMQMMPGIVSQRAGVMGPHGGKANSGFSFLDKPARKEDHTFDFVQDAIKTEKTHK